MEATKEPIAKRSRKSPTPTMLPPASIAAEGEPKEPFRHRPTSVVGDQTSPP